MDEEFPTINAMIDAVSNFGFKNALRRDIVTQDIFFDKSEEINIRKSQFCYAHINTGMLAKKRYFYTGDWAPIEIKDCMKQELCLSQIQQKLCVVNCVAIAHIVWI